MQVALQRMADQEREMAAMAEASKQTYINQQQVKSDLDMLLLADPDPLPVTDKWKIIQCTLYRSPTSQIQNQL